MLFQIFLFLVNLHVAISTSQKLKDYQLIPIKEIGSRRTILPADLSCSTKSNNDHFGITSFQTQIPLHESPTRVGTFCRVFNTNLTCSFGAFTYTFKTSSSAVSSSRQECQEIVSRFTHGHHSGFLEVTPNCAVFSFATKTTRHYLVTKEILPFSPELSGVKSSLFHQNVCQDKYCLSSDGLTHWFLDSHESPGCTGTVLGFGELRRTISESGVGYTIGSSLIADTPLKELCIGSRYCGKYFVLNSDFQAFLLDDQSLEIQDLLLTKLVKCPANSKVSPIPTRSFRSRQTFSDKIKIHSNLCQDRLNAARRTNILQERHLGLFVLPVEGISAGYRIENGKLWQYSLLYRRVRQVSIPHGNHLESDLQLTFEDTTGSTLHLSKDLCIFEAATDQSLDQFSCTWFNGIKIGQTSMIYPSYTNSFNYLQPCKEIQFQEEKEEERERTMDKQQSESLSDWFFKSWVLLLSLFIAFLLILSIILIICCCKCRKHGDQSDKLYNGVTIREIADRDVSSERSISFHSVHPRRVLPIQNPPGPLMINWFGDE